MLSYLSSWFGGNDDDPGIIRCRKVVLDELQEDSSEWIWVDVDTNKEEDVENILKEYIVIPAYPSTDKQSNGDAPTLDTAKRFKRRHAPVLKIKKKYPKLKIYPPLKAVSRRMVCSGLARRRKALQCVANPGKTLAPNNSQCFPFGSITYKGLEGFDSQNLTWIVSQQKINSKPAVFKPSEIIEPRAINKPTYSWQYIPKVHENLHDVFAKLSTEGWWILTDSSGHKLSSSMVRLSCIKKFAANPNQASHLIQPFIARNTADSRYNSAVLLVDKLAIRKRRKVIRKKINTRRKRNELTTKPGHISLITKEINERDDTNHHHRIVQLGQTRCPDFSFARGVNSLVHSSKDIILALGMYLTQMLDTVTIDEDKPCHHPQVINKVFVSKDLKYAQKYQERRVTKNIQGRKNIARMNATKLQRSNKAIRIRRKAMGRFNCAVKRSY